MCQIGETLRIKQKRKKDMKEKEKENVFEYGTWDMRAFNQEISELLELLHLESDQVSHPEEDELHHRIFDQLIVYQKSLELVASVEGDPLAFTNMSMEEMYAYKRVKKFLELLSTMPNYGESAIDAIPTENKDNKPHKKTRKKKFYLLVATVTILTLAFGLVGVAAYPYIRAFVIEENIDNTTIFTGSEENFSRTLNSSTEDDAYVATEECLGIPILRLPEIDGLIFEEIEVDIITHEVSLFYSYNNNILRYKVTTNTNETLYITDEEIIDEIVCEVNSQLITITSFSDYTRATFLYNGVFYTLIGDFQNSSISDLLILMFDN